MKKTTYFLGLALIVFMASCSLEYLKNPIKADFSADPPNCSTPDCNVQFTNLSIGDNIVKYLWDFDDGVTEGNMETNPQHFFEFPGDYCVKLTAYNKDGDSSTTMIYVTVGAITFEKYGTTIGSADGISQGKSGIELSHGGYIVTGSALGTAGSDGYEVVFWRLDEKGSDLWNKTKHHSPDGIDSYDVGNSIIETSGGDLVVCGTSDIDPGPTSQEDYNILLLKVNGSNMASTVYIDETFGNNSCNSATANCRDQGYSIQNTSDGGYIMVGTSYSYATGNGTGPSKILVVKTTNGGVLDSSFDQNGLKSIGAATGAGNSQGYCVRQTSDNGYIICGSSVSSAGDKDIRLIKLSNTGDIIEWNPSYRNISGNSLIKDDEARSVRQLSDGSYIVCGYTSSIGNGSTDVFLLKVKPDGSPEWFRTYGGPSSDSGYDVDVLKNNEGFIFVGSTQSFTYGKNDVYLVKTNLMGDDLWSQQPRHFGKENNDEGFSVQQTSDDGFFITGHGTVQGSTKDKIYVIKTSKNGR